VTLKELSDEMHSAMIELRLSALEGEACELDTQEILTPAQTYQKLLRNGTEKVKFTEMAGRIAGVMLVPYPPGIPVCMPGERLGGPDSPVIKLILALEEFGKRFPGFEREVHGIEVDAQGDYWMRGVIEIAGKRPNGKNRPPSSAPPVKRKRKSGGKATPAKVETIPLDATLNEQR
jgi:arginine decarboxylase